jgi:hypothetical protein
MTLAMVNVLFDPVTPRGFEMARLPEAIRQLMMASG